MSEPFEVHYSYDESPHANLATFATFEEALDFADFLRGEINPLVGGWVEFDEIAAFAKAIEWGAAATAAPKEVTWEFVQDAMQKTYEAGADVQLVEDPLCPPGKIYFLNQKYIA